jgi:hypothetical protein
VVALTLVAGELAAANVDGLRLLLGAAQELARAHGVYDATDICRVTLDDQTSGVVASEMDMSATGDLMLLASSELC